MIGNKTAEKDIREYLSENGYYGKSARFEELELHAIKRPGWLQVFRFGIEAKTIDNQWLRLFGAMKDDERFKLLDIQLFENRNQRDHLLKQWSEGLSVTKNGNNDVSYGYGKYISEFGILAVIIAVLFAILIAMGV